MFGLFDSGSGGMTVLRAIRDRAPNVDVVYLADTANIPYGSLPADHLQELTLRAFARLKEEGADVLVSACNSISTAVIRPMFDLLGMHDARVVEMVGPTVRSLVASAPGRVSLVATPATISSGVYQQAFLDAGHSIQTIVSKDLAAAIEHAVSDASVRILVRSIIDQAVQQRADTLVLSCTHYPLVFDVFAQERDAAGAVFRLVDPAPAVAAKALSLHAPEGTGETRFLLTKDEPLFHQRAQALFPDSSFLVENVLG